MEWRLIYLRSTILSIIFILAKHLKEDTEEEDFFLLHFFKNKKPDPEEHNGTKWKSHTLFGVNMERRLWQ